IKRPRAAPDPLADGRDVVRGRRSRTGDGQAAQRHCRVKSAHSSSNHGELAAQGQAVPVHFQENPSLEKKMGQSIKHDDNTETTSPKRQRPAWLRAVLIALFIGGGIIGSMLLD